MRSSPYGKKYEKNVGKTALRKDLPFVMYNNSANERNYHLQELFFFKKADRIMEVSLF